MSPRASASSARPMRRTATPPKTPSLSSIASISSSSRSASSRPPSATAHSASSARSCTSSSVAPSRRITGQRGAGVHRRPPARSPRCIVSCGELGAQHRRCHGPSSSLDRARARAGPASTAPAGSPRVLARVAQPLRGGERRVPVGVGGELLEPRQDAAAVRSGRRPCITRTAPARRGSPPARRRAAQQSRGSAPPLVARDHRVDQQDRHRRAGRVLELGRRLASRAPRRPRPRPRTMQRVVLAAHRPEACRARRAAGRATPTSPSAERAAQLVGEVDLLGAQGVDRRDLLAAEQPRAVPAGVRDRPARRASRASPSSPASTSCIRPNSRTVSSIR